MHKKSMKIIADFIEDIQNKDEQDNIYHIFDVIFDFDQKLLDIYKKRGCESRVNEIKDENGDRIEREKISSTITSNTTNIAIVGDYLYNIFKKIDKECLNTYPYEHYDEFGTFFHYLSEYNKDLYDYMDAKGYVDEFYGIDNVALEAAHS